MKRQQQQLQRRSPSPPPHLLTYVAACTPLVPQVRPRWVTESVSDTHPELRNIITPFFNRRVNTISVFLSTPLPLALPPLLAAQGVLLTHDNITWSARQFTQQLLPPHLTACASSPPRVMSYLPLSHVAALGLGNREGRRGRAREGTRVVMCCLC